MGPSSKPDVPVGIREVHLRDYWKIVWQGRWTVLAAFALVVAVAAGWSFLRTPIYRAIAVVEVQPQARRVGPGQDVSGLGVSSYGWFAEERYQNTQIEIIKSRVVGEHAFAALGLKNDPDFKDLKDPIGAFIGRMKVDPRRETGLIEISIEGPDREEIARWANAIADAYVDRNLERARENTRSAVDAIKKLMEPLKADLSKAEQERFKVLEDTAIYSPENQKEIVKNKLSKLSEALSVVEVKLGNLRSVLSKIQEIQQNDGSPIGLPDLAQDSEIQDLNRQKVQLERDLESAKVTYRPGHPVYQEKVSQLQKVQARLRERVSLLLGKYQTEYDLAASNEVYLKDEIRKAEEASYRFGVATSKYDVVNTDAQTRKQIYDSINKTLNEVAVGADLLANNVSVLDHAIPPLSPVKPQKRLNLALGGMMGLFLGLALVFFLDYLDNTFRSPEDVERFLHLSTLAVVPKFTEDDAFASNAVKEAYQTLRTGLIFLSRNRERRVVLITSSGPREGKSSTVANLARALASAGDRVVVVDCDLRRPTQHVHLKLERDNGLSNYLAAAKGMDDWRPYVKTVGPSSLHAITCGPIPPNPPELLGSERFAALLRDLRESYDWILLDSPPAMSLADAVLLSSISDLVVLVIQHSEADRDLVSRSVAQFRKVGANLAGVILNNVDIDRAYKKDYYYAGYYYYGSDGRKKRGKRVAAAPTAPAGTGTSA
ncbi:MAG: polysaccharide biosynthesis tyrosine autokinase [Acidobacteriia bacterium]|nr:polysaccharide biosynthesis tyrosine autokinase [Terriglobia bacterium]